MVVAGAELERMAVLPADGDLQHEMQVVEPDRDRHLDAADHRRRHLVDLDPQQRDVGHVRGHVGAPIMPKRRIANGE